MPPDPAVPVSKPDPLPEPWTRRFEVESPVWRAVWLYGFAALLCLGGLAWVLQLRNFNPLYPFDYSGDSLLHAMAIKAIVEHGWFLNLDRLGAPDGLRLEDFPMGDNLCCAIIRVLALGTSNPFLIQNLLFIGLFPVTAVVACWTLRRFGLSAGASLLGGLLYALLPYHFMRGTWHLFLTAYFLVPPVCLVAWWATQGALLAPRGAAELPVEKRARRWRLAGSGVICAAIGCNAVYYPFFACAVLAAAGLYALVNRRDWRHFVLAESLAALVGSVVVANLLPTIIYVHEHGKSDAGLRSPGEAETYGLKLVQLLLPITDHRLPIWVALKNRYNLHAPLVNENDVSGLGVIGGLGLLLLLGWLLFVKSGADSPPRRPGETAGLGSILGPISVLNLAVILFGTIGGFSSLFALLVSPQVRAYNRISVFIAFFALLASAAVLDHLVWRRLRSRAARAACFVGMLALAGFGVWDQTSARFVGDYHRARHQSIDDARYFARIEKVLPPGAMVFQLPAVRFPEAGNINAMGDYSHLRGYVQTRTLRWSYGAIRGGKDDVWNQTTAAYPPEIFLQTVAAAGFSGVYLDGSGYADNGRSEIEQFSQVLDGAAPLLSADGLTAFFDLKPHTAALLKQISAARREALLHALHLEWKADFSGLEKSDTESWRWCGQHGDLLLFNDSPAMHKAVRVSMKCRSADQGIFDLHVSGDLVHQDLKISDHDGEFSRAIDLPPGQHVIHFDCDAPRKSSPGDPRSLVWLALQPEVNEVTAE